MQTNPRIVVANPEMRVAAETALAGGWLKAPLGPSTMMITKKSGTSFSVSGGE